MERMTLSFYPELSLPMASVVKNRLHISSVAKYQMVLVMIRLMMIVIYVTQRQALLAMALSNLMVNVRTMKSECSVSVLSLVSFHTFLYVPVHVYVTCLYINDIIHMRCKAHQLLFMIENSFRNN